ncbi:MAG: DNA mismatch repair endonuclease MutL [Ktedonobacteraceae bacterium]|nr:DNA mismatch repair endonuclease MutL [Ktedonobacteraceae bacterium]
MPIRQLAPDVAAKIAAGEVVERPASVVKELLENSIDAGATQLRVDLMNGGLQLIRVTDNGSGIPADELPLALSRHATSKVAHIDDLEHIRSLGFRGEALASIAAVADVVLISRPRGSEQSAQVSAANGEISRVSTAASPEGSIVTVRNLFSSVPARLKFLKSRNTEVSHCLHLLEQYALAYPEIRFSVFSEGRQIFNTPGDGQLFSVLIEIYGLQVAEQMVPISSPPSADEERPVVSGYVSRPTCYKSTRQHLSFFVNRRWVLSRMLSTAVEEAYRTLLLGGRHPIAVVNIQLDPTLIDVNVHPAKTEIRFLKERRVYAAVMRAVRSAVLEEANIPTWRSDTPAPTSANANTPAAAPAIDDDIDDIPFGDADTAPSLPTELSPAEDGQQLPAFPQSNPWMTVTEEETGTRPPLQSRLWQSHIRPLRNDGHHQNVGAPLAGALPPSDMESASTETYDLPQDVTGRTQGASVHVDRESASAPMHDMAQIGAPSLAGAQAAHPASVHDFPELRVIGQLLQSYVVTEGSGGMYLIDQHAAHERVLLERMVAALKARAPISQLLLTPMQIELAPVELEAIEVHIAGLVQIGFSLEILEDATLQVKAVPNVLMKQLNARSLRELLVEMTGPERAGYSQTWEEHALANVACKAAIKANYFLTVSEMRELIEQLARTSAPYSCCHGRPTMVSFSASALEREFGRR